VTNVAVTVRLPFICTVQLPAETESHPVQPDRLAPTVAGMTLRVTLVPGSKEPAQLPSQEMAAGDEVISPAPSPPCTTVSV
jgi:hypothetical protein